MNVVILVLALAAAGLVLTYTLIIGISPLPTTPRARRAMFDLLPTELEGTIFELGSGWGTLAVPLARRYPRCRVVGYELSPVPWLFSRLRQVVQRLPNLTLNRGDFHCAPLGDAALVVCYLFPGGMEKLKPKLEAELAPGTLILSNFFRVPGWRPAKEATVADMHASTIYLYRVEDSAHALPTAAVPEATANHEST